MKGRLFFSLLLLFAVIVLPTESFGQCKFKKHKKFLEFPKKSGGVIPKADQATKTRLLLEKMNVAAAYSFVQSGKNAYFYLQISRGYSKKFVACKECPLTIFNNNGQSIQLLPIDTYKGRFILTMYTLSVYYKITKEELLFLTNHDMPNLKFTFSKQDVEGKPISLTGAGWSQDSQGRPTFKATIQSSTKRDKLRKNAQCISTKL